MAHSAVCLQVLEFVDEHGNEVLNLGSFTLLPEHVVRLILSREDLRADEFTKFQVSMAPRLTRAHQERRISHPGSDVRYALVALALASIWFREQQHTAGQR